MKKKQPGFLLLQGLILLLFMTVIVVGLHQRLTQQYETQSEFDQYLQARYLAEAGLAQAQFFLKQAPQNERMSCTDLANNFPSLDFMGGRIQISCSLETAKTAILTQVLNPQDQVISVNSTLDYAPSGYLEIDGEFIFYTQKTATQFLNIQHGISNTRPSPHLVGKGLTQAQGKIKSQGQFQTGVQYQLERRLALFEIIF